MRELALGLLLLLLFFGYTASAFAAHHNKHSKWAEYSEDNTQFGLFIETPGDELAFATWDDSLHSCYHAYLAIDSPKSFIHNSTGAHSGHAGHYVSYRGNAP